MQCNRLRALASIGKPRFLLCSFQVSLKLCQWALVAHEQRPSFPFRKVNPVQCQEAWYCVDHLLTEKHKTVLMTSDTESSISGLGPSVFSYVSAHNWQDRWRRHIVTTEIGIRSDFVLLLFHSIWERLLHSHSIWRINQTNFPSQNKDQTYFSFQF